MTSQFVWENFKILISTYHCSFMNLDYLLCLRNILHFFLKELTWVYFKNEVKIAKKIDEKSWLLWPSFFHHLILTTKLYNTKSWMKVLKTNDMYKILLVAPLIIYQWYT